MRDFKPQTKTVNFILMNGGLWRPYSLINSGRLYRQTVPVDYDIALGA